MPTTDLTSSGQNATILDVLASERLITAQQMEEIKVKSASLGRPYEETLTSLNIVPAGKLAEAKAKLLGIPFISLFSTSFSPQALNLISRAVAERFLLIPFLYDEKTGTLSVAMANPANLEAVEFIRQKTGLNIKTFASSPQDVKNAINAQY